MSIHSSQQPSARLVIESPASSLTVHGVHIAETPTIVEADEAPALAPLTLSGPDQLKAGVFHLLSEAQQQLFTAGSLADEGTLVDSLRQRLAFDWFSLMQEMHIDINKALIRYGALLHFGERRRLYQDLTTELGKPVYTSMRQLLMAHKMDIDTADLAFRFYKQANYIDGVVGLDILDEIPRVTTRTVYALEQVRQQAERNAITDAKQMPGYSAMTKSQREEAFYQALENNQQMLQQEYRGALHTPDNYLESLDEKVEGTTIKYPLVLHGSMQGDMFVGTVRIPAEAIAEAIGDNLFDLQFLIDGTYYSRREMRDRLSVF